MCGNRTIFLAIYYDKYHTLKRLKVREHFYQDHVLVKKRVYKEVVDSKKPVKPKPLTTNYLVSRQ